MTRTTEVSAAEAGRRLSVDKATATRWLQSGKMHGTRTAGGHWRVSATEIERLRGAASEMSGAAIEHSLTQALSHLTAAEAGTPDAELRRLTHRAVLATQRAAEYAAQLNV
jgi:excisionase family DNA binding protein